MVARGFHGPRRGRTRRGSRPSQRAGLRPAALPLLCLLFLLSSCCRFIALPPHPSIMFLVSLVASRDDTSTTHDWYDRHDPAAFVLYIITHSWHPLPSSSLTYLPAWLHDVDVVTYSHSTTDVLGIATTSYIRTVFLIGPSASCLRDLFVPLTLTYVLALRVAA